MKERILIATIGAPHGVKGQMKVFPVSGKPDIFDSVSVFYTEPLGGRSLTLRLARISPKAILIEAEGVGDRTQAEKLTGTKLYLSRENFPEPGQGEYYHADLIGLRAVDGQGRDVGVVVGVENFGAGDLLEIRPAQGETFYLTFTPGTVPDVDISAGILRVEIPDGPD